MPRLLSRCLLVILPTLLIAMLDHTVLGHIPQQLATSSWQPAPGKSLSAEVTSVPGSKSTTYKVSIRYSYEMAGRAYTSDRLRFGNFSSSDFDGCQDFVTSHSAGTALTAYVDPRNPEQAVLERGLQGSDLTLALMLGPFNAVILCLWMWALGYTTADNPSQRRFWSKLRAAVMGAGMGLGCLTFPAIFGVAIIFGMNPPISLVGLVWAAIAATSLWLAWGSFHDKRTSVSEPAGSDRRR